MQGSVLLTASSDLWIQRSKPHIYNGAEDVGNINSSVRRDGRRLNVLRR